jgi:hypothetical protein
MTPKAPRVVVGGIEWKQAAGICKSTVNRQRRAEKAEDMCKSTIVSGHSSEQVTDKTGSEMRNSEDRTPNADAGFTWVVCEARHSCRTYHSERDCITN